MLPTVPEEAGECSKNRKRFLPLLAQKPKLPLALDTYIRFYRKVDSLKLSLKSLKSKAASSSIMAEVQSGVAVPEIKVEEFVTTMLKPSNGHAEDQKEDSKSRKDSETGDEGEGKKARKSGSRNRRGLPRRSGRNDRRRFQYNRSWEKTHEEGMVVTHVLSPTQVYMQTQRQQLDYKNLQDCMAKSYGGTNYKPSIVAANMLLGVKIGDSYERVRTEEVKEDSSSDDKESQGKVWKVLLVDRGSSASVSEDSLNFLLAGLNDLQPLAIKYTLNELRVSAEATEAAIEETKKWFSDKTSGVKVDCEIFKPNRENSVYYVDVFIGENLLNNELVGLGAVEPKSAYRWKNSQRTSTSSIDDAHASPASGEDVDAEISGKSRSEEKSDNVDGQKAENSKVRSRSQSRRSNRGGRRWYPNSRRRSAMNTGLKDWAVVCYDPSTSPSTIGAMIDSMMKSDNTVVRPEDILIEHQITQVKDMISQITDVAHAKTSLALMLCIPPEDLEDVVLKELELAVQSLGLSVVFAKGSTLSDSSQDSSKLLKQLQEKYKLSPAYVPSMSSDSPTYGNNVNGTGNRRRRDRYWNQNRQRNYGKWDRNNMNNDDALLTSIKDLTAIVKNMQLNSCDGNLNQANPSALTVQLSKAVQNLQDVQTNYKQTRAHCVGALGAVTTLLSNLSHIVAPSALVPPGERV